MKMGVKDPKKKYAMEEMASGDVIVSATGVTDGALLKGVVFSKDIITTETIVYRSTTGTVRRTFSASMSPTMRSSISTESGSALIPAPRPVRLSRLVATRTSEAS